MKKNLTSLVGKPDIKTGGWVIPRPANAGRLLRDMEDSGVYINVKVRDELQTPEKIDGYIHRLITQYCEQAKKGSVKVVINHGPLDPTTNKYLRKNIKEFKLGQTYAVPIGEALRLLNSFPYNFIFEEVSELVGELSDAPIEDQNKQLRAELDELKALLNQFMINSQNSATKKKTSLKDIEE